MWVAKVKINSEKTLIGSTAKKNQTDITGYPISFHKKGNNIICFVVGEILGEEKEKKNFIKDIKKDKRIKNIEIKDNFMSALIYEPLSVEKFYNPKIIYVEPIFISKQGYQIYHVASWDKKELSKFIRFLEKSRDGKILKIQQEKIGSISIMKIHPELTEKQNSAMVLAIKNGYYNVPRKTSVQKLAKITGLSFATFQVHLRKAEQKLIPFLLG